MEAKSHYFPVCHRVPRCCHLTLLMSVSQLSSVLSSRSMSVSLSAMIFLPLSYFCSVIASPRYFPTRISLIYVSLMPPYIISTSSTCFLICAWFTFFSFSCVHLIHSPSIPVLSLSLPLHLPLSFLCLLHRPSIPLLHFSLCLFPSPSLSPFVMACSLSLPHLSLSVPLYPSTFPSLSHFLYPSLYLLSLALLSLSLNLAYPSLHPSLIQQF